uniref:Acyltransferase 3 domain-containing protein n=1 Tax=Tanacetum cinerariifolium TaxID=118510 RepID=A0A699JJA3_TANCI|nr:hypothetical protein [Tanacetum cinerariifolium]
MAHPVFLRVRGAGVDISDFVPGVRFPACDRPLQTPGRLLLRCLYLCLSGPGNPCPPFQRHQPCQHDAARFPGCITGSRILLALYREARHGKARQRCRLYQQSSGHNEEASGHSWESAGRVQGYLRTERGGLSRPRSTELRRMGILQKRALSGELFLCPEWLRHAHTYGQRLGTKGQFRQFFITRTFRLYPLHVFVLFFAIALEIVKLSAEHAGIAFNQPSFTGQRAPQEIIPNLLLLQSWWPGFNPQSFNFPAWSISVEYYIYMIFAGILLCTPRFATLIFLIVSAMAAACLSLELADLMEPALQGLSCFFAGDRYLHDVGLADKRERSQAAYFDGGLLRADVGLFFRGRGCLDPA